MKAVVQRISSADVSVNGKTVASAGRGLMVFVGLGVGDGPSELDYIVSKVVSLRVFEDKQGKMNLSVGEAGGSLMVVSQFTLYGSTRKGCRPSFTDAMPVEDARKMWPMVESRFLASGILCSFGEFQSEMKCSLVNDGPVTLIIDSSDRRSRNVTTMKA